MSTLLLATLITIETDLPNGSRLLEFSSAESAEDWYAINDGVMGGVSSGRITWTGEGTVTFEGRVSLENNGGFSSVRSRPRQLDLSRYDGLRLRVRGDGHRYKINFKTDDSFDGLLYRAVFDTQPGRWQTIVIPFSVFEPTYRGRVVENSPALDLSRVRSLGLMISDKQAGPFVLEIDWIDGFSDSSGGDDSHHGLVERTEQQS
jgi:monofunctional biosynthetic peptidoglycan transglycosylase